MLPKRKEQYIKKYKNQFVTFPSSQWTAKFNLVKKKKNMLESESSLGGEKKKNSWKNSSMSWQKDVRQ